MVLKENTIAPEFSLKDKDGKILSLSKIKNDFLVIYFYPKDFTTGCTIEAKEFSEKIDEFHEINTEVIGISGLGEDSKKKFTEKYNLRHILLADPDFKVSMKYEVYGEKTFLGKKYLGINRITYVLDKKRKIIKVYTNVKSLGHAKEVLEFIKNLV